MGLDKKEPGDRLVWTAEVYNRWARAANAMMRAGADQHFGMTVGPHGRQIAREAEGFWAKLSGAGPTYTAVEQLRDPATTAWVDGPRSLTSVIEVNAVVGLAGTVQFVEPSTSPGEWLFQVVKLGATATPPPLTCNPCAIPKITLTGTGFMTCAGTATTFPFSMTWNGVTTTGGARWNSGCVALPCGRNIVLGQPQANYASYILGCTAAGASARFTALYFDTLAHCTAGTNIYGINGTTGLPNNQTDYIYPTDGVNHTLASIGDCTVFDLVAKTGTIQDYIISE
jgi:hypothetical protein